MAGLQRLEERNSEHQENRNKNPEASVYTVPNMTQEDGLLYYKERLYAQAASVHTILKSEHDSKVAGHFGQDKTIELIRRNFWWPGMNETIKEYVKSCQHCQEDKARRHKRYGLLLPTETPYKP